MSKTQTIRISGSNGKLPLASRWLGLFPASQIHGGPFRHCPVDMAGVCLLEMDPRLQGRPAGKQWLHMPIVDFSVPRDDAAVDGALRHVFTQLLRGSPVYVGCMGGWGRTGLFLSLVAKAAGIADPIDYVRAHYTPRAVETPEQEAYVARFDVAPIRRWLRKAAVLHVHHRLFGR